MVWSCSYIIHHSSLSFHTFSSKVTRAHTLFIIICFFFVVCIFLLCLFRYVRVPHPRFTLFSCKGHLFFPSIHSSRVCFTKKCIENIYSYCYDPFCVSLNRRGKSVHPVVYNNFDNAPSIRKPFILDLQYLHRYDFVRWANYYFYNRSD